MIKPSLPTVQPAATPHIPGSVETLPASAVVAGGVNCCMGSDGTVLVESSMVPPSVTFSGAIVGVWVFSATTGETSSLSEEGEGVAA